MTAFGDQAALLRRHALDYVEGLTDDELHWEPAPGMWGLRLKTELRTPLDEAAPGEWWVDSIRPAPEPVPFTTIGWRVVHLTLGTWNWNAHLEGVEVPPEPAMFGDAAQAVELWTSVLDRFVELSSGFTDAEINAVIDAWGEEVKRSYILSHVTLEIALHSAEVGTMRHLYRATHGR